MRFRGKGCGRKLSGEGGVKHWHRKQIPHRAFSPTRNDKAQGCGVSQVYSELYTRLTFSLDDCRQFYAEEVRFAANLGSPDLIAASVRVAREKFLGPGPRDVAVTDMLTGGVKYTATGALMKVKSMRRDEHELEESCAVHGPEVCLSMAELAGAV